MPTRRVLVLTLHPSTSRESTVRWHPSVMSDEYARMTDVPIALAATAWDDPETGQTTI
jgi:hypothetical protein